MRDTLANPTTAVNAQRIRDAFGPNPNLVEIGKTVDRLHAGNLQIATADPTVYDTAAGKAKLAKVSLVNGPGGTTTMGSAMIGSKFHDTALLSDRQRAGTLIHEATHQQRRTGDDVIKSNSMVIRAGDRPKLSASQVQGNGGCMCFPHSLT